MIDRIRQITALGQALWLDNISRDLLRSGALRGLIAEGLTGVTSNPTIFQKSIAAGGDYAEQIRRLAAQDRTAYEIYEAIATEDVGEAADQLRPVFNETHGRDGYVSIEVNPQLAHDTDGSIAEGRRLFATIGRPNVMIKIPATEAGLPAITALIGEGINVNVTLIFAVEVYERVMRAYLDGLRRLGEARRPLHGVSSVASFFVSRVDTLVDSLLQQRMEGDGGDELDDLVGQAAVANSKVAYAHYKRIFEGADFEEFRNQGARVQRPLWASTSTKNPDYSPTLYVDTLIGPNTVNTVPPQTLEAIRASATVAQTVDQGLDAACLVLERLQRAGIDMKAVTDQLTVDGVKAFADSFEKLLADIERVCETIEQTA
jgi:transaldolase/glucose-6-phosphate isomerase